MDQLLLRADEVAEALSLGRSKIYEMMANGELPVIRLGRAVRVPAAALENWLAKRMGSEPDVEVATIAK